VKNTKHNILKVLIALSISLSFQASYSQVELDDVNFLKIPQKKIHDYIHQQIENNLMTFYDVHASYPKGHSTDGLSSQQKSYLLQNDLSTVRQLYRNSSPAESWEGNRMSFGLLFSKPSRKIIYRGEACDEIEPGQIVYLNLRLLRGIYNLAIAFEIIDVDDENKIIEFSYVEGNKSIGKQRIHFKEKETGQTEITHISYFKSHSRLRDRFLYPYFHKRLTNEFHRKMRKILENSPVDLYAGKNPD